MRVFAAVLPLFLLAFPAAAQVIRVPQDQPTIQQAINAATNGTTILVAPGTYTQLLTVSAKTLTIRGEGGAAVTTLQANNGRALTLSSGAVVTLENFTVRPQFTPAMAGIMVTSSTLHLRACVLRDSQAPSGAALQLSGASQATVSSCEFLSNSATNFGGAISVVNNGALVVHNSAFRQNSSGIAGGAIDLQPGTAALANCLFANNSSANGGALATVSTGSSFRNCTLVGNSSGPGVGYAVAVAGIFSNAVALHNSIVWGNTGGAHTSALGSTSSGTTFLVTYSDVQGGHPGP
ncbi:MAG TPA: hypothetical protein VD963_01595, partial [Phycisphaerales bacterium]|nr:hypothetical protein [Phycisphaerales bacterium]